MDIGDATSFLTPMSVTLSGTGMDGVVCGISQGAAAALSPLPQWLPQDKLSSGASLA